MVIHKATTKSLEERLGESLLQFWTKHAGDDGKIIAEILANDIENPAISEQMKSMLFFFKLEFADQIREIKDEKRKVYECLQEAVNQYRKEKEENTEKFLANCTEIYEKIKANIFRKTRIPLGKNFTEVIFLEEHGFIRRGLFGGYRTTRKKFNADELRKKVDSKFDEDSKKSSRLLKTLEKIV